MATHLVLKSHHIALALLLGFGALRPSWGSPRRAAAATSSENAGSSQPAAPAATSSKAETAAPAPSPAVLLELEQLRENAEAQAQQLAEHSRELESERAALREQLERIAALEANLGVVPDPSASSAALTAVATPTATPVGPTAEPRQDLAKQVSSLESRVNEFGPFSFSGDFRLRSEPFFGGPVSTNPNSNDTQDRNRMRYRARLFINARLNDDISGGLALATGDINDPISTNQTANQDFTRKPFYLDRAFITYTPHQVSPLTLIGGKFAYPWYNTELTWDKDINPEGVAEKLEWKSDSWHVLRQFALIGFQLPFGETARVNPVTTFTSNPPSAVFPYPNDSIKQSVVYGGQIQTRWQLAPWLSFTADTAFYNWHNADQVALANQAAYGTNSASSPAVGLLKQNGTLTNSYQVAIESFTVPVSTITGGAPCVIGKPAGNNCTATVNSYVIAAKLNSKFALTDSIAQFDITTPHPAWPIRFLGDYVQNTEACANNPGARPLSAQQLAALPADATVVNGGVAATGAANAGLKNGVCNPADRKGYWLEARFGRQQEKRDWQFAYTRIFIDREAVLSLFDYSEMRQGSNVEENRVEALYNAYKNVQLGFIGLFGRQIGTTDATETVLKRLQFDVVYKF